LAVVLEPGGDDGGTRYFDALTGLDRVDVERFYGAGGADRRRTELVREVAARDVEIPPSLPPKEEYYPAE
jgi:hypothetical protein